MVNRNQFSIIIVLFVVMGLLSGCGYNANQVNPSSSAVIRDSLTLVQSAVENYKNKFGVLPIKNFTPDTPEYEQCIVDFKKLMDNGVLGEIPTNAFEKGGSNYYVIVNPDTKPTVKLLDLVSMQAVNELQTQIDDYRLKHRGTIPSKTLVANGWFTLDYTKLKVKKPTILSPYSKQPIELLVALNGKLCMDYATDIMQALQLLKITNPQENIDLRTYLVDAGYYVPGRSFAYYWQNEQPVLAKQ